MLGKQEEKIKNNQSNGDDDGVFSRDREVEMVMFLWRKVSLYLLC